MWRVFSILLLAATAQAQTVRQAWTCDRPETGEPMGYAWFVSPVPAVDVDGDGLLDVPAEAEFQQITTGADPQAVSLTFPLGAVRYVLCQAYSRAGERLAPSVAFVVTQETATVTALRAQLAQVTKERDAAISAQPAIRNGTISELQQTLPPAIVAELEKQKATP